MSTNQKPTLHFLKALALVLLILIVLMAGFMYKAKAQTIVHDQPKDTTGVTWKGTYSVLDVQEFRGRKIAKVNLGPKRHFEINKSGQLVDTATNKPKYIWFYCSDTLREGHTVTFNWMIKP